MCVLSVTSEVLLEGRERSISTLKSEIPGCTLMCKCSEVEGESVGSQIKKRHLKIWDFYRHWLLTLTTSPPSTFISCFKFWCNRLVLDLHFSSPKRSTRNKKTPAIISCKAISLSSSSITISRTQSFISLLQPFSLDNNEFLVPSDTAETSDNPSTLDRTLRAFRKAASFWNISRKI